MPPSPYRKETIKDRRQELLSKIRIIDDLIPKYNSAALREQHQFESIPCNYYTGGKIGSDRLLVNFSSKLTLYADAALAKINYGKIKHTLNSVFLVSDNESPFREVIHRDDSAAFENGYTLSYHFMGDDNCGGTSFYEDFVCETPLLQIPFKENRLVIFPACIPHTGYTNAGYANKSKRVIYTLFTILDM